MTGSPALEALVACARAIEDDNSRVIDSLLERIWNLAADITNKQQREVVKYYAEALVRRAYGIHPPTPNFNLRIPPALCKFRYCFDRIDPDALLGKKRMHFVDFIMPQQYEFEYLFGVLTDIFGDIPPVRVSVVLPPFLQKGVDFQQQERSYLMTEATQISTGLEDSKVVYANGLGQVDNAFMSDLRRTEDEAVVVIYVFKLHKLLAEAGAIERELLKLRLINPEILIIVEQDANHNDFNDIKRLEDSFQYYFHTSSCHSLSSSIECDYRREIENIVGCEDRDRVERHLTLAQWGFILETAGLFPLPLEEYPNDKDLLKKNGCLVFTEEDRPVFFVSAWKFNSVDHFNPISYNFLRDFEPVSTGNTLQPLEVFVEGFSVNRLAAFAEIYDMSEDVCSKYELPLALTWVSGANRIVLDPHKQLALSEETMCRCRKTNSSKWSSLMMLEIYKNCILEEGQGIAGKALQSNEPFLYKPSELKYNYPYTSAAQNPYGSSYAAVAICLQNRYTIDVYVLQLILPLFSVWGKSDSFARKIFNYLKNMRKIFVRLRAADSTEVGFRGEAISNFPQVNKETHSPPRTKQRKLKSKVWDDFQKVEENGKLLAVCNHCKKQFTGSSKSGTTHLKNHWQRCPQRKLKFPAKTDDLTTRDSNGEKSMFDQEKSRLEFAKMIVKHQYPLDMAEQEFFRSFVRNLQPMFEFQSQATIISDIHRIYEEEKKKLQQYFDQLACNFSLTLSLWKGNQGKNAYCCLIAHFIDDGWQLKMKILSFKNLEHNFDKETLSGIILSSISEWDIGKKVCSITVDSSSFDDDIVQQMKESCLSSQGSLPSGHSYIGCTLIREGLQEIDDILLKIRKSIEYVNETEQGRLKFREALNQVKLQGGKCNDDRPLRLDSDFGILDSALEWREVFFHLQQIDANFRVNPSTEEWDKAWALHSCLKDFDDISSGNGGSQSFTTNGYFPKLCNMYKKFLLWEKKSNYPFITLMKRKFDNYWSLYNLNFAVASVLDPQLKFKFVEFSYSEIYGHDSKVQLNRFHKVLTDVYYEYANDFKNLNTFASVSGDFSFSSRQSVQSADDCILDSFSRYATSSLNEVASWKSELDCYLGEPLLNLDRASFDILGWWRVNSERFPTLGRMAQDLLAMPFSVVPPCANFNFLISEPSYDSLSLKSMEAMVSSQNWLEMPKTNDRANHASIQNRAKRKMEETENHTVKSCKNRNHEELSNGGGKAKASYKMMRNLSLENVQQEGRPLASSEPNHGRDITGSIQIPYGISLFDNLLEFECSSSYESNDDSRENEKRQLSRWQNNEMSGKLMIGRDKELGVVDFKLAPLLKVLHGNEIGVEYYIEDTTFLIEGSRSDDEVLSWFLTDYQNLISAHKLFLPMCLSAHWLLFYVDTKEQKLSWLDPKKSSRAESNYIVEKGAILRWFTRSLLPALGYHNANQWPFLVPNDIPEQTNLVDCGVFVMKYADCLTHGDFFPFTQQDMPHFRLRTFLDIDNGRLCSHK